MTRLQSASLVSPKPRWSKTTAVRIGRIQPALRRDRRIYRRRHMPLTNHVAAESRPFGRLARQLRHGDILPCFACKLDSGAA